MGRYKKGWWCWSFSSLSLCQKCLYLAREASSDPACLCSTYERKITPVNAYKFNLTRLDELDQLVHKPLFSCLQPLCLLNPISSFFNNIKINDVEFSIYHKNLNQYTMKECRGSNFLEQNKL